MQRIYLPCRGNNLPDRRQVQGGHIMASDEQHPAFTGVALKHILTSEETDGAYSYHLVRIAPNCSIGEHIHETQLETHEVIAGNGTCINEGTAITYGPGIISVFPANVPHEVNAGEDGLCLFTKFMPALC